MKESLGAKGQQFPQLVMIIGSYGLDGTPDAMNAAWISTSCIPSCMTLRAASTARWARK